MEQQVTREVVFYGEYEETNMEQRSNVIRDEIDGLARENRGNAINLIRDFRAGSTSNMKPGSNKMAGLFELSGISSGKVRVILCHVEGNIYVITHVYYNKSDSATKNDIETAVVRAKDVMAKKGLVLEYIQNMRADEKRAASEGFSR